MKGKPIPGSRYYRNYCERCGAPLRVTHEQRNWSNLSCEECGPRRPPPHKATKDDTDPGQENAIRHLEDR